MMDKEMDTCRIAFLIAAYGHYLKKGQDDSGSPYKIDAPALTTRDWEEIHAKNPLRFLKISPFRDAYLSESESFKVRYLQFRKQIESSGVLTVLEQMNQFAN